MMQLTREKLMQELSKMDLKNYPIAGAILSAIASNPKEGFELDCPKPVRMPSVAPDSYWEDRWGC